MTVKLKDFGMSSRPDGYPHQMFPAFILLFALMASALGCAVSTPTRSAPPEDSAVGPSKDIAIPTPLRLAILNFENSTADPSVEKFTVVLPDLIMSNIAGRGQFTVLERSLLTKLQAELTFQASGLVADDKAVRVGSLSGATALLVGRVFRVDSSTVRIDARLIGVERGEVLGAYSATGQRANVVGLASQLSLQLLSSFGANLYPSEHLLLGLMKGTSHPTPDHGSNLARATDEIESVSEGDNLFWRQFSSKDMTPAEDYQGIALLANDEIVWPGKGDVAEAQGLPADVTAHFKDTFISQVRNMGLLGLIHFASLEEVSSRPYRILLVPRVDSASAGWDCPWYAAIECRIWQPRYAAQVQGRLAVINRSSKTYWESSLAIGTASAPTREQALKRAYDNLIWKWTDLLAKSKLLRST